MTLPDTLLEALQNGTVSEEQIRELISIEATELDLTYDEALRLFREGALPTGPIGTDIEFLAGLFAA